MRAVDCQGFGGAFALGVVKAGFELAGKREQEGGFGIPMLEGNRRLLPGPWTSEACAPQDWTPEDVELVFGNPPCSGFSGLSVCIAPKAGSESRRPGKAGTSGRIDWRGLDAPANACMWALVDYAAKCDPQVVVFESVQPAGKAGRPLMQALRQQLEDLTGDNWDLLHVFQNDLSLGGWSMRKRYFFVASRVPFGVEVPRLRKVRTLRDAISDLESVELGTKNGHVPMNTRRARRLAWLASVVDWAEGEHSGEALQRAPHPLPDEWYTRNGALVKTDSGTSLYSSRRWYYDRPARVLTGLGLEENVHPALPRTFTHREAARIMGFPDSWRANPAVEAGTRGMKWWGKQLPVTPAKWIATWARRSLDGEPGELVGELVGDRERVIDCTSAWKARTVKGVEW